jgi:membrane fusion protein, multidrug efflux system
LFYALPKPRLVYSKPPFGEPAVFFGVSYPAYAVMCQLLLNAMLFRTLLPFLLFSLLHVSCHQEKSPSPPQAAAKSSYAVATVEGFVVRPTALAETVTASGTLVPAETTELHPEMSGRVVALNLPEGRPVRQGEVLLKIFDEDLRTQLRKLETQLKQAEITGQRLGELLKVKGVSQQEYDLAELQSQNLRDEMDLVRINLAKTEVRAPYAGILGLRNLSLGAYVTPATAITTIRSVGDLKLDFAIPEKYAGQLRVGQPVSFSIEGVERTYNATVIATAQSVAADTRNLQVRAVVRGDGKGLLPGAFAEVQVSLGQKQAALMIPSQAVIPQARDKKVFVSRNGKAASVVIRTGVRQANLIEVVEGLVSGDTIATTGILFLRPDAPLKFEKVN